MTRTKNAGSLTAGRGYLRLGQLADLAFDVLLDLIDGEACWWLARRILDERVEELPGMEVLADALSIYVAAHSRPEAWADHWVDYGVQALRSTHNTR